MLKKTVLLLYIVVVAVMAAATFVEHFNGYSLYDDWWFTLLWALLAAFSIVYFLKQHVRRLSVVVLHLSFVVILAGALLTHVFARQGAIHLRTGETTSQYVTNEGKRCSLPFSLRLDSFSVIHHEGTTAAADYKSYVTFSDGQSVAISMNNIHSYCGVRFYQASYDSDRQGTVLSINSDPWGIAVTYTGYVLLFMGLIWILIDPKGQYRQVLRSPLLKKGILSFLLLLSFACCDVEAQTSSSPRALPQETAESFGRLLILYNDRICPVETYALDFTMKLYGKRHYGDYTAMQVLTGFIFYGDEWCREPIIRIKNGSLKEARQLPDYCSVMQFFTPGVGYVLGPYVREYYQEGRRDAFRKQVAKLDDQLMMVMNLRQGQTLKLFPVTAQHGVTTWYSPISVIDTLQVSADHRQYIQQIFTVLNQEIQAGHFEKVDEYLELMRKYQEKNGGRSLPSDMKVKAEHAYNAVPFVTILAMCNLTMGCLSLLVVIFRLVNKKEQMFTNIFIRCILPWLLFLSLLILSYCEALRWMVSGTVPMSNGYETMLLLAWLVQLIALFFHRRFYILPAFGFLLSGFFLLVSHISQMDPQIGRLMPVLNSPLLTIHVSVIMMSFALLSLTFVCGVTALCVSLVRREDTAIESLALLSRLFLYPALTTLGAGIFIGAVWANVSWGSYWSWDPKEVWALITFMTYAVVVHTVSFPVFRSPIAYHVFVSLAFLTILMTYFGVNYLLGGMHSYA